MTGRYTRADEQALQEALIRSGASADAMTDIGAPRRRVTSSGVSWEFAEVDLRPGWYSTSDWEAPVRAMTDDDIDWISDQWKAAGGSTLYPGTMWVKVPTLRWVGVVGWTALIGMFCAFVGMVALMVAAL